MTYSQKKILEHVLDLIKQVDTYPTYSAISKTMNEYDVNDIVLRKVLATYQDVSTNIVNKPISAARKWLDALLKDI